MAKKPSSPKKTKKTVSTSKPREAATTGGSVPHAGASVAVASAPVFSQGTAPARPVRSNRGIGGQRAQLEKASAIVGEGLLNKVTGQKRDRNTLTNDIPQDLLENNLAPPISTKRARINKAVPQGTSRVPDHGERPLQAAPKPALTFTAKGSPYGFPKVSGPKRSKHKALLSITNVQVNTLANSNESNLNSEDDIYKSDNDANGNSNGNNGDTGHDGASHHGDNVVDYNDNLNGNENDNGSENDNSSENDNGSENDNENLNADDGPGDGEDEDMGHSQFEDPQIDEVSPSEDDRAAEAFLREYAPPPPRVRGNLVPTDEGAPHNVLAQHHIKNRSNQPPELARLATAGLHQATLGQDGEPEDNHEESDDEDQDHSRAARHSKSTGEVKPDTMAYYKGTSWWVILTQAKIKYRRHIALNHGFPDRDEHLSDARDILLEVIEEFKAENEMLDQNFQPVREMECLIFKEGATFRGRLKTVAHLEVEKAFRDELHPPDGFESQRELKNVVERNVADLLSGGNFLMNGKDDTGRTNNLAHPCLRDICISFFYTGKNALARSFPDDFRNIIPDRAIALVATTMRHCLQRYASGMYIDCKFEGIIQSSVYSRMLVLITEIRSNLYHKAKHDSNRRHWAKLGMQHLRPQTEVENHNLAVILD